MTTFDADEQNTRRSMSTLSDYSVSGYSQTPGMDGIAWSAQIRKNDQQVGSVHDSGRGGCLTFTWDTPEAREAFTAEAKARYGVDGFEVEDTFAHDLASAYQFNRKRSVLFITDDQQVSMGEIMVARGKTTASQVKNALLDPTGPYAAKNPMIWDKRTSVFVPAADFTV